MIIKTENNNLIDFELLSQGDAFRIVCNHYKNEVILDILENKQYQIIEIDENEKRILQLMGFEVDED